jgi:clan AA aspartic protease
MGKVIEKVRLTSLFDPKKSVEIEAVIDTGATMVVLPKNLVRELGLEKIEDVKVKYADGRVERKKVYGVVRLELKGRIGNFDVLAENEEVQPLIGQIVLERLDLIIEPSTRKLIPNPRSPEMPMIEVFMATAYNSKHTALLCFPKFPYGKLRMSTKR